MTNQTVEIETAPAVKATLMDVIIVAVGFLLTVTSPLHLPEMSGAWSSIIGMAISARMNSLLHPNIIWRRFSVAGFWLGLIVPIVYLAVMSLDLLINY